MLNSADPATHLAVRAIVTQLEALERARQRAQAARIGDYVTAGHLAVLLAMHGDTDATTALRALEQRLQDPT